MAIKLNAERRFTVKNLTVWFPGENGNDEKGTLDAVHFKMASRSRVQECIAAERDLLDEVLIGLEGVTDPEGQPLVGDEAISLALEDACVRHALWQTYVAKIQSKNIRKN